MLNKIPTLFFVLATLFPLCLHSQERTTYQIQLGMHRVNLNSEILKYEELMSRADFAKLRGMGILRKADIVNIGSGGRVETNLQRITIGDYLDTESAIHVWRQVRKLGDKYPALGFDKCFIISNSEMWRSSRGTWNSQTGQSVAYTVQIASVRAINADEYAGIMREFGNVFFQYRGGVYRVCVGLFNSRSGTLQSQLLQRMKSIGYTDALMRAF